MSRFINAALILLMLVGAGITYEMKHRAETAAQNVARLNAEIARQRQAISVLKAEWSLLSQPGRLQAVIAAYKDHFKLEPFSAAQVATLDEVPVRQPPATSAIEPRAVAEASGGIQAAIR